MLFADPHFLEEPFFFIILINKMLYYNSCFKKIWINKRDRIVKSRKINNFNMMVS